MSKDGNRKKNEQLGMNFSTAAGKLRKMLLWKFVQETGNDICFQCGETIENLDQLSMEHKIPWLDSEDPVGLYFNLDNIAFSHISCNCAAGKKAYTGFRRERHDGFIWCAKCEQYLDPSDFTPRSDGGKRVPYDSYCRACNNERIKMYHRRIRSS